MIRSDIIILRGDVVVAVRVVECRRVNSNVNVLVLLSSFVANAFERPFVRARGHSVRETDSCPLRVRHRQ